MAKNKIILTTVSLNLSAMIYAAVGLVMFILAASHDNEVLGTFFLLFCLFLAVGILFVVRGIKKRKYWAWIAGICICGLYIPSAYFPLGALGLWGLLDAGSREEFGVDVRRIGVDARQAEQVSDRQGEQATEL